MRPTLVASHPGNTSAVKSGIYSRAGRVLGPRAQEIAEELMSFPHVVEADAIAAEEIGSLVALLEAIDPELGNRGVASRSGAVRSLLELRVKMSGRLERWLTQFGLTPAARAEWAARLAGGGLAAEIARLQGASEA